MADLQYRPTYRGALPLKLHVVARSLSKILGKVFFNEKVPNALERMEAINDGSSRNGGVDMGWPVVNVVAYVAACVGSYRECIRVATLVWSDDDEMSFDVDDFYEPTMKMTCEKINFWEAWISSPDFSNLNFATIEWDFLKIFNTQKSSLQTTLEMDFGNGFSPFYSMLPYFSSTKVKDVWNTFCFS